MNESSWFSTVISDVAPNFPLQLSALPVDSGVTKPFFCSRMDSWPCPLVAVLRRVVTDWFNTRLLTTA